MAGQNIESYLKLYGIELFQTPEWLGWTKDSAELPSLRDKSISFVDWPLPV